MWRYVFLLLRRQPGKSVLASFGFLLAACALILLSATTQTTVVQAIQIINSNWRSTYDLVILPPQADAPQRGTLVPADQLEGYDGGISIQQYHQIQHIPGVAVAAPIAYLGYVHLPLPTIRFTTASLPSGYYQLNWTLTAFNGQQQIVEIQESKVVMVLFSCQAEPSRAILDALDKKGVVYQGCGFQAESFPFQPPDTGTFLLAAIDPGAENQLLHLNQSIVQGRILTQQDTLHLDSRFTGDTAYFANSQGLRIPVYAVPMLIHQQLPGQITLHSTFVHLASTDAVPPQEVVARGGTAYLTHLASQQTLFQGQVPLVQNDPQRFVGADLVWDGHSWRVVPFQSAGDDYNVILDLYDFFTPSGLNYQSTAALAGQVGPTYKLVPTGIQGPEVTFRNNQVLHLHSLANADKLYSFDPVGQFRGDRLAAQFGNSLNWLPETTYAPPPVVLRYDAQGRPVSPTLLIPTTNTAGYILQPPLALTTLATAVQLRGDHVISAIRVRVAGVDRADPQSWQQIQRIAATIEQHTHLRVLVTLGSSPTPVLVYVPGIKPGQFSATAPIAPLGWVEERWITLGAGIVYLQQLGATRLLLLGTVLLVCLGYLVVAESALVAAQRKEFAILSALGWPPWQPARLFLSQALFLGLGGGFAGVVVAVLAIALLGASPIWLIVGWTLPAMLVMALLSSLYPLWQLWRIQPAEILRAGASVSSAKASLLGLSFGSCVSPLWALVVRNLTRSRPRTLLTIGSLFLSAVLLVLMVSGILALRQALQGTLLGDFVLLQTAVPQIAGGVFAVLLTFLSVADLLLLQVRERQQEIGLLQAVGWQPRMVHRLFVQEGLMLAMIGAIPGVLVALGILALQHTVQTLLAPPLVAISVILFMIFVAALATIPAVRAMNRMQVVDVLRAE